MKITLVLPQSYRPDAVMSAQENFQANAPMGLLYLAAGVAARHDVAFVDAQFRHLAPAALVREILGWQPDLVGVSINFTTLVSNAMALAKCLSKPGPIC